MYTKILIRFGELSTKGKNKMSFVRQLASNIKKIVETEPEVHYDRIFIDYSNENIKKLQYVFGIYSYSPVVKVETNDEIIDKTIIELLRGKKNAKTFRSSVKKSWKGYHTSSMDKAREIGSLVLKNFDFKVDLKNYDFNIELEIKEKYTYVFVDRILGIGGYPTGINGKVLHLISGGIDSPVAAYEMMKRGIHVDYINFITPPHTDELTIDKVNRIIKTLDKYQGSSKLYRLNYTDLMNYIGLTSKQAFKITLMRRSFYRIVSKIVWKKKYLGISNGENLGQVASQTLESIAAIQDQCKYPIYRPVLTNDKLETIAQAKKIGTFNISIEQANEACELFAPDNPVTKPKIWQAKTLEDELTDLENLEEDIIHNHLVLIKY